MIMETGEIIARANEAVQEIYGKMEGLRAVRRLSRLWTEQRSI